MSNLNDSYKLKGIVERRLFDTDRLEILKEILRTQVITDEEKAMLFSWAAKPMFKWNKLGRLINKYFKKDLQINLLTGIWTKEAIAENLITTRGKQIVAERIGGSGGAAAIAYLGVGTGATAANATDTALQTEITDSGLARASATVTNVTTTTTSDTEQFVKSFSVTGTKAVTEEALFDAVSSGNMLARQVFSAVNVVNGDTLQFTHKIIAG